MYIFCTVSANKTSFCVSFGKDIIFSPQFHKKTSSYTF